MVYQLHGWTGTSFRGSKRGDCVLNFYKTSMWKYKRLAVLKRDGYCCQECKRYGKNRDATVVHHVNPLLDSPELRLQSWNLLSLCNACHDKMHDRNSDVLTETGKFWKEKINKLNKK